MARKVPTQLRVALVTRNRADAIAIVTGQSRAEVYRHALEGRGLQQMEEAYVNELKAFDAHAARFGMTRLALAGRMAEDGLSMADIESAAQYP